MSDQDYLIPARMLNEYVYCPRLAYLEYVQGEWQENSDTVEGKTVHKRVDRETGSLPAPGSVESEEKIHARSLSLGDAELGITAKLDLVEAEGLNVTPVDYKKGKRPHVAAGAYDPERVQLCAQGLLLRKAGYETEGGVLYFAGSKERVKVSFDDELEKLTHDAISGVRSLWGLKVPPPPLEDSPKCPRCSLVSICLPDEVNWFSGKDEAPRPISVRTEEKLPLYVQAPFGTVRKKGEVLEIEVAEEKHSARIEEISHLALFGNVHLTTPALQTLLQKEIPVSWHTQGGWYYGCAQGLGHKNIQLRVNQYKAAFDSEKSLKIARSLVRAKILNCRTMLRRNWKNDNESPEAVLLQLKNMAAAAARADDADKLFGIEGQAGAVYFASFSSMLGNETGIEGFSFSTRNRRPPADPVNAMLSFAYSIIARSWAVMLHGVGFDPYLGFYHRIRPNRPALALDLMEPFRPVVADSAVLTAINNGEMKPSDFVSRAGSCALTVNGRKAFIGIIERRLGQEITHPVFGYRLSYRRLFELEARLLGRFLSDEIPHYPGFITR